MVDIPLSDAWIGAQVAKIREATKSIPLSDAWIGGKLAAREGVQPRLAPYGGQSRPAADPTTSQPVGEAGAQLGVLDRTVSPDVNLSALDKLIAKTKEA